MKTITKLGVASMALAMCSTANAATLTQTGFDILTAPADGNSTFNISVFDGAAGYEGVGQDGITATSGTFGDGTVLAYNFITEDPNDTLAINAQNGGLISTLTTADTSFNDSPNAVIWTTTDPSGFTSTADITLGTTVERADNVSGSIDISGLASGQIYIIYGDYRGTPSIDLTMIDALGIAPNITLDNAGNNDFANDEQHYVVEISFTNDLGYDSIDFTYNGSGGARSQFTGVVVDGVVAIPEPSSTALIGLGGLALILRRRR